VAVSSWLPAAAHESASLAVTDASGVGEARRAVAALAARLEFGETVAGRVALVVTEAAANLVKHARGGEVLWRQVGASARPGIEVIALDKGPGILDVARSLQDGYSTSGTPGTGLGAIRRLSDEFDLFTGRGRGTAVLSRVYPEPPPPSPGAVRVAAVCLPKQGEEVSGDGWSADLHGDGGRLLVVDGLGHGPDAHRAALRATAVLAAERGGAAETAEACHHALRGTRGAALAVAELDRRGRRVRFAGVGNVTGAIFAADRRHNMVSINGTAGQGTLRIRAFEYAWDAGATIVMASDGLATRWSLDDYPGLASRDPALIASVLYRDHTRGRDDVTVLVARESAPGAEGR
jgi:anti-sigma regulatory factor (Ser/Thr protein kinase)